MGTILHYAGTSWSWVQSGGQNDYWGIWGSSSDDVFIVGSGSYDQGRILHYDGDSWTSMASGSANALYGVWGSSPTNVFAVGDARTLFHYSEQPPTVSVAVDFDPDTLNLKSKGKPVTVYIELPTGHDVSQIDVSSIRLNGAVVLLAGPTGNS